MKSILSGNRFLVLGRVGLDIYPEPIDQSLQDSETWRPVLGGSAGNIAAGLGRLGNQVSMLSCLSDDAIAARVRREMESYGVAHDLVRTIGGDARSSIHFAENLPKPEVVLYRNGAADFDLSVDDVARVNWAQFDALILSATALAREPSKSAVFAAIEAARGAGVKSLIDLDYRKPSWNSIDEARAVYREVAALCDIIIGNDEEFDVMGGGEALAREMGQDRIVIYKMGAEGSIAFDHGQEARHGIFQVHALKPIGAGDAFMAGFSTKLAQGGQVDEAVRQGSAAAAIVVSKPYCAPAMPTQSELDKFLKERS